MSHCVRKFQVQGGAVSHCLFQNVLNPTVIVEGLTKKSQACQVQMYVVDDAIRCLLQNKQTNKCLFCRRCGLLLFRHQGGILPGVGFVDHIMWSQPPSTN